MESSLQIENLEALLSEVGNEVEAKRKSKTNRRKFSSKAQLERCLPETSGLYWIETNMPETELLTNIRRTTSKDKKVRATEPEGIGFCKENAGYRVVYR
jgi:hypothetical protein